MKYTYAPDINNNLRYDYDHYSYMYVCNMLWKYMLA